jgi:hypothetical protein
MGVIPNNSLILPMKLSRSAILSQKQAFEFAMSSIYAFLKPRESSNDVESFSTFQPYTRTLRIKLVQPERSKESMEAIVQKI